jgi:hypothetical protein
MKQQWRCSSGKNERGVKNRVKLNLPPKLVLLMVSPPFNANVQLVSVLAIEASGEKASEVDRETAPPH